ncbi:MAG: chemotaxis protein CheW [Lysobacter sp.]
MSAQMVDAYLDELLAPLAEDARVQSEIQAGTHAEAWAEAGIDSATDAAVAFAYEPAFVAPSVALTRVDRPAQLPVTPPTPATPAVPSSPRPEPATALPVQPPQAPGQTVSPLPVPRHLPEPTSPTTANGHVGVSAKASHGTAGNRWLRAALGRDRYAFELLRVQEVVRMSPIIALRGTATAMLGVMNLRGRVVPVFDLAQWLGTGRVDPDEHARIIVVERDDELIGVLVSAVDDVVTLSREHIEPPLPGTDSSGMVGIARIGRQPTVLLDADALFD